MSQGTDTEPVELYDALMTTRAMRRFTDEPVADADIEACLRAAVQAPSGGNIQPYQFLVVTDPDQRARLGEIYLQGLGALRAGRRRGDAAGRATEEAARRHARNVAVSDDLARSLGVGAGPRARADAEASRWASPTTTGAMDVGPTEASVYPAVQNLILAGRARGLGTVLTTVYRIHQDEVRERVRHPRPLRGRGAAADRPPTAARGASPPVGRRRR